MLITTLATVLGVGEQLPLMVKAFVVRSAMVSLKPRVIVVGAA